MARYFKSKHSAFPKTKIVFKSKIFDNKFIKTQLTQIKINVSNLAKNQLKAIVT